MEFSWGRTKAVCECGKTPKGPARDLPDLPKGDEPHTDHGLGLTGPFNELLSPPLPQLPFLSNPQSFKHPKLPEQTDQALMEPPGMEPPAWVSPISSTHVFIMELRSHLLTS